MFTKEVVPDHASCQATTSSRLQRKIHFHNIIKMYNNGFNYIKQFPNFHIGYDRATRMLLDLAKNHVKLTSANILDLCCGHGHSSIQLAEKFNASVIAIDINQKQISALQERLRKKILKGKVYPICENIEEFNFTKLLKTIDIIWCEDALSHIFERRKLFSNISNNMRPGSFIIFTDLIKSRQIDKSVVRQQEKAWCLKDIFTSRDYMSMLGANDLRILEFKTDTGKALIEYHLQYNHSLGDQSPEYYYRLLENPSLIRTSQKNNSKLELKIERLKTFKYLRDGDLDYLFIVAVKK